MLTRKNGVPPLDTPLITRWVCPPIVCTCLNSNQLINKNTVSSRRMCYYGIFNYFFYSQKNPKDGMVVILIFVQINCIVLTKVQMYLVVLMNNFGFQLYLYICHIFWLLISFVKWLRVLPSILYKGDRLFANSVYYIWDFLLVISMRKCFRFDRSERFKIYIANFINSEVEYGIWKWDLFQTI